MEGTPGVCQPCLQARDQTSKSRLPVTAAHANTQALHLLPHSKLCNPRHLRIRKVLLQDQHGGNSWNAKQHSWDA